MSFCFTSVSDGWWSIADSKIAFGNNHAQRAKNRAEEPLYKTFVEYSGLEPLTSTLPVLRSSQMR